MAWPVNALCFMSRYSSKRNIFNLLGFEIGMLDATISFIYCVLSTLYKTDASVLCSLGYTLLLHRLCIIFPTLEIYSRSVVGRAL